MENILFRITLFDGDEVAVNVENAKDIFDAADEVKQSIEAGDIKVGGVAIERKDVYMIVDVRG